MLQRQIDLLRHTLLIYNDGRCIFMCGERCGVGALRIFYTVGKQEVKKTDDLSIILYSLPRTLCGRYRKTKMQGIKQCEKKVKKQNDR